MPAGHDRVSDPAVAADVLLAGRGTAYFSGKLDELTDEQYDAPSLLPGWTRRHVIAHVGYNARALTRLVEWARTGVQTPMYASTQARAEEIDRGATLPPTALRDLHHDALVTLSARWRDLPADRWSFPVRTAQGRTVPVSVTPWMRVREVWLHAVDLDNGGRFEDFPPELLDRLLGDITGWWARSGAGADLVLEPTDRTPPEPATAGSTGTGGAPRSGGAGPITVRGTAAQLVRWASGRGADGVVTSTGEPVAAPRWL
jgi:maleylpyruvate isomerase